MSGIYGVVSKKAIEKEKYKGLEIWNKSYGDGQENSYIGEDALISVKPEQLKDDIKDTGIILDGNPVAVFDCLIYSNTDNKVTDSELLYSFITNKGIESIRDINGDFAGALYDAEKHQLTVFRDHMGVRPLFYYVDEDRVIFSTDIRGILAVPDVDASVDERWLYRDFSGYSNLSAEKTEYKKIRCVPFGGYIVFSFEQEKISSKEYHYWIPGQNKVRLKNREEYEKRLRSLIEDAIRIRLNVTNRPVGAELSGGLDSGVIDLLLAGMRKDCKYYSWSPSEEVLPLAENDERLVIKDICKKAGIKCDAGGISIRIVNDPLLKNRFPLGISGLEFLPYICQYAFPMYVNSPNIFETASFMKSNNVKFIFTGHGGDEGVSHRSNPYELFYNHEYLRYIQLMFSRTDVRRRRIWGTIRLIYLNLSYAKKVLRKPFHADKPAKKILNSSFCEKYKDEKMDPLCFAYDPKSYVRGGGSRNRLDVLAFYSACTGERYLIPFLDYRVIDYALGIPRYLFLKRYNNRAIYRDAFKDIMPDSLYEQKLKEDMSYRNLPPKDNSDYESQRDSEEIVERKKEILACLDRETWERYLNYEMLDGWVNGRTSASEDGVILFSLFKCIQIEYSIKRAREVNNL